MDHTDNIHNSAQRILLLDLHQVLLGLHGECKTDNEFDTFINELKLFSNNDREALANIVYEAIRKNDNF